MVGGSTAWIISTVLAGMLLYALDSKFGQRLYRFGYGLTHKDPLPEDEEKGFLVRRKTKQKFIMAILFSIVFSVPTLGHYGVSPINALILFFTGIPFLMLGFTLGPGFMRLWTRKFDPAFETIDKIESGETTMGAEFSKRFYGPSKGKNTKAQVIEASKQAEPATEQEESKSPAPKEPEVDPQQFIRELKEKTFGKGQ